MLRPDQWTRVFALFHEALDRPPEERSAWLATACEGEVRAEVERLLDAEAAPSGVMKEGAGPLAAALFESDETAGLEGAPARVGPYRLVREIGRGGMSAVYLAERDDGAFERRVALKVLHRFFGRERQVNRFRAERQILASLDHPNIAKLHDGGVLPDGRPYLVMEYVDGRPIDTYCAEHNLPLADRLDLLAEVCEAVQHAHQQLVVHRDVKPANILVTPDGTVKLLDFGISKLLDANDSSVPMPVTRPGERWMTPEYAAPEQVEGAAVSTATDVYQIGVLAYELLAGRRPFLFDASAGLSAIEETVLTTTPAAPSTVAETEVRAQPLAGDLDTIVLKALRKNPEQRYATPQDVAQDLARYRAQRPIEARPPTWRYRACKFLQRNRMWVGGGALALLVVVGAAVHGAALHDRLFRRP